MSTRRRAWMILAVLVMVALAPNVLASSSAPPGFTAVQTWVESFIDWVLGSWVRWGTVLVLFFGVLAWGWGGGMSGGGAKSKAANAVIVAVVLAQLANIATGVGASGALVP